MERHQARRICKVLGWGPSEAARQYNRLNKGTFTRQYIADMMSGRQKVSSAFSVFLRLSLTNARLRRRNQKLEAELLLYKAREASP